MGRSGSKSRENLFSVSLSRKRARRISKLARYRFPEGDTNSSSSIAVTIQDYPSPLPPFEILYTNPFFCLITYSIENLEPRCCVRRSTSSTFACSLRFKVSFPRHRWNAMEAPKRARGSPLVSSLPFPLSLRDAKT